MPPLIMAIDDSPEICEILRALFVANGYDVVTAADGYQALSMMQQQSPDLILCDIMMPGMDGLQLFQRVRADRRWAAIPFAFLTARSDSQTRFSSTELGVEAYVTKPFGRQELLSVVAGLLRRAKELHTYTSTEMESFKAQLLFMITHELNTPLSVMRMVTDSLRGGIQRMKPEDIRESLDLMSSSTSQLSWIVESMLLALQIDSGRAQQLFENWSAPQQLASALEGVVRQAAAKAAQRGVGLDVIFPQEDLWVVAHDQQLKQILARILDNAIQFSPDGGVVTVRLEGGEGEARVAISDRGPGMTRDEVEKAFDRLRQINRAQQEQQGVGLSLNLVRSLVTIHGGRIVVDSAPGAGSTFTVCFPQVTPDF